MCKIQHHSRALPVMFKNNFSTGQAQYFLNKVLFILIMLLPSLESVDECQSSFQIKMTLRGEKYCYKKKDPESFFDKFVNCPGNLISYEMYKALKLPKPGARMWAEYKSLYPGGVFVDSSNSMSIGDTLENSLTVYREGDVNLDVEYCVVVDPVTNFTMVRCDEHYFRYCVMKPFTSSREEPVTLTVHVDALSSKRKLFVNYTKSHGKDNPKLNDSTIKCFTDSHLLLPQIVSVELVSKESLEFDVYELSRRPGAGYYWCTHTDPNFYKTESNKALYIDESDDCIECNEYSVRIKYSESYNTIFDSIGLSRMEKLWKEELKNYVFYSKKYSEMKRIEEYNNMTIKNYKDTLTTHDVADELYCKLKRLYLDRKTVLAHIKGDDLELVRPGQWNKIFIEYIKPAYYCDKGMKFKLGDSYTTSDCMFHKCSGNYNDGVETISTKLGPDKCTPQDRLDIAIDEIEKLVNSVGPITTNTLDKMFTRVDDILTLDGLNIKGNFLHLLDDIVTKIDLNGPDVSRQYQNIQKNIALVVADALPESPIKGFQLAKSVTDSYFTNGTITIIKENSTALLSKTTSEVVVSLPDSISTSGRRISFVVFRDSRAFQGGQEQFTVNSKIVSVKVENLTTFSKREVVDIYLKPLINTNRNEIRTCAFWKFNADDIGSWSQKGCNFTSASQEGILDVCRCNHLTHFAEILIRTGFPEEVETMLERLSVIGCCVSIFGLLLVGLTAAFIRSWRREYSNKIYLQLCASILIMSICFLVVVYAQFQENNILCILTGVVLHYSLLSSFCWMLVSAIISYKKLVVVFGTGPSHKLLRASAFAWGAPCIVLGMLFSVAPHSYGQFEVKNPSGAFCYPTGLSLWLTVYTPITLILISNGTLFVLIARSAFAKNRPSGHKAQSAAKEAFRTASVSFLLVFLFGLPWLFGLFSFNIVCAFLFTIFVTFQGFILFFFFVGNKRTRDLWLIKLKLKQASIPGVISTDRSKTPLNKKRKQPKKKLSNASILSVCSS